MNPPLYSEAPKWVSKNRFLFLLNDLTIVGMLLFIFPMIILVGETFGYLINKFDAKFPLLISFDWKNMLVDFLFLGLYFYLQNNILKKEKLGFLRSWFFRKFHDIRTFYWKHPPLPTFCYFFLPLYFLFSKIRRQEVRMFFGMSIVATTLSIPFNLQDYYAFYLKFATQDHFWTSFRFWLSIGISVSFSFILNFTIFLIFFLPMNATFIRYYFEGRTRVIIRIFKFIGIIVFSYLAIKFFFFTPK